MTGMNITTVYCSPKQILIQPPGEPVPVVWPEYDAPTQQYFYRLTAEQAERYGPALAHEGAVEVPAALITEGDSTHD